MLVQSGLKLFSYGEFAYPNVPKPLEGPAVAVLLPPKSPPPLVVPVPNPLRFWFAPKGDGLEAGAPKPIFTSSLAMIRIQESNALILEMAEMSSPLKEALHKETET